MVTAVGGVGGVVGVVEFGGVDEFVRGVELGGQIDGIVVLGAGQAGAAPGDREHVVASERVQRDLEQDGAVDAAGMGDQDGAQLAQTLLELVQLVLERWVHGS